MVSMLILQAIVSEFYPFYAPLLWPLVPNESNYLVRNVSFHISATELNEYKSVCQLEKVKQELDYEKSRNQLLEEKCQTLEKRR